MKYIHFENNKWRFKGRRANVIDAIAGLKDRKDSPELMAKELDVPVDAIKEAILFYDKNPDIVKERIKSSHKFADKHVSLLNKIK